MLGRGGFGWVVSAEPHELPGARPDRVAIKIARRDAPRAAASLRAEARALEAVGPPVVPTVYGHGELVDGSPYLIMEQLDGTSLASLLVERGELFCSADLATVGGAIVEAVARMHERGWAHGDLKPENLYLSWPSSDPGGQVDAQRPDVRLIDLGLATELASGPIPARSEDVAASSRRRQARGARDPATQDGSLVIGTAEYMAPEQCSGRVRADASSDIYALGIILYEMLVGRPPFFGGVMAEIHEAHQTRRPTRPSSALSGDRAIGRDVEDVVLRCLAKEPDDRLRSARELGADLRRACGERGERVAPRGSSGAPARSSGASRGEDSREATASSARVTKRRGRPKEAALGGKMAVLWLRSSRDAAVVERVLGRAGGILVHAGEPGCAAVFEHRPGLNPAEAALAAARELVTESPDDRVIIDLATVKVRKRRDGSRRYFSPLFSRANRFPVASDPAGVMVSAIAARALGASAMTAIAGRHDGASLIAAASGPSIEHHTGPSEASSVRRSGESSRGHGISPSVRAESMDETLLTRGAVPLVGRDRILADLVSSARGALDGEAAQPTIASVVADGGHGKSYLAQELCIRLCDGFPRARVLALRARVPGGRRRESTLSALLTALLRLPPGADLDTGLAAALGQPLASRMATSLALALGRLAPDAPEARALAAVPGALRTAAARAASAVLRHLAGEQPLVIVLDDAHLADQVTLDALEQAAMAENRAAIWICSLARPGFERTRPEWGRRSASTLRVELEPLDRDAASELCLRLLHPVERIPARAIERLIERTQGIPLLLVELVKGLESEGLVRQHSSGSWYVATDEIERLPDLPVIEWLAGRELETLSDELAAHAQLVALLGADSSHAEMAGILSELERDGVVERFPLDPGVATRRLLARGLLVWHRDSRAGFRYDVIRDEIAKAVPDDVKSAVHRAAYRFYRRAVRGDEPDGLSRYAFHAERSGHHRDAADTCLILATRAAQRHDYLGAEILYSRALDQMAVLESRAGRDNPAADEAGGSASEMIARRGRALMRYRLGRYQDSLVDFARARELASSMGDTDAEIAMLLDEATALDWCDEWQESAQRVEQAAALAGQDCSQLVRAHLFMARGRSLCRQSRNAESIASLTRAVEVSEELGDPAYEIRVIALILLGYLLVTQGQLEDSESRFDEVIALCQQRGDPVHLAAAFGNRSMLWMARNDVERMLSDLRSLLVSARELGNARLEQHGHYYLGQYLLWMGDLDEAERHARRAKAIDDHRFADSARQESSLLVARVLAARGELDGARVALEEIGERQVQARSRGARDVELIPLEEIHFAMIDLATQDRYDDGEWSDLEARFQDAVSERDMLEILEARAATAARLGEHSAARVILGRAADMAGRLPDALGEQRARIDQTLQTLDASSARHGAEHPDAERRS